MSDSIIQKYSEKLVSKLGASGSKIEEHGRTLKQGGESLLVGAALGAVHGTSGLDQGGVPIDGVAAAVGLGAAIAFPTHPYADEARNAGSVALGILGFRKTAALVAKKGPASAKGKAKVRGEDVGTDADAGADEDPLVAKARDL